MASDEIFEDLHNEWLCRLDSEGYPLYLGVMYYDWYIRDTSLVGLLDPIEEVSISPEWGEEIRDLPF